MPTSVVCCQTPGLFRAKRINHCNDFVARAALEVVDGSWWKPQLRVKSAGSGTTALSSNEGHRGITRIRVVSARPQDARDDEAVRSPLPWIHAERDREAGHVAFKGVLPESAGGD